MDLWSFLWGLKGKTPQEREAQVRNPHRGWITGRLIALRQSAEVTRWIQHRLRQRAQWKQETVSAESLQFAEYFMVWRMKSILGLGHLPKKYPLSAKAWLEGKLFTGLLIERMVVRTAKSFSPWS